MTETYPAAPVRYDNRARKAAPKYGVCPLCGWETSLVLNRCRLHNLVRGSVCYSCSMKMQYLDCDYPTSRYYPAAYHAWLDRCSRCYVPPVTHTITQAGPGNRLSLAELTEMASS